MMAAPATSIKDFPQAYTDRVKKHKDGSVLLSVETNRICRLNGVGALTWMILEDAKSDLSLNEVVLRLRQQFDAINAEGEFSYEVSPVQLHADTFFFLNKLVAMNLLHRVYDAGGLESFRIQRGVSGTTSSKDAEAFAAESSHEISGGAARVSKRETVTAFLGLLAFDLLLKFGGFRVLIEWVQGWPTATPLTTDIKICRHVRAMVDRAQMYYPKKAMCLQHSAVVTCLLRRRGVPAQMVLAAHEFPVRVHAWSEVEGYVVNDQQSVKKHHREMRRV